MSLVPSCFLLFCLLLCDNSEKPDQLQVPSSWISKLRTMIKQIPFSINYQTQVFSYSSIIFIWSSYIASFHIPHCCEIPVNYPITQLCSDHSQNAEGRFHMFLLNANHPHFKSCDIRPQPLSLILFTTSPNPIPQRIQIVLYLLEMV